MLAGIGAGASHSAPLAAQAGSVRQIDEGHVDVVHASPNNDCDQAEGETITISLKDVQGAGDVTLGVANGLVSVSGNDYTFPFELDDEPVHIHPNWTFSESGTYKLTFEANEVIRALVADGAEGIVLGYTEIELLISAVDALSSPRPRSTSTRL